MAKAIDRMITGNLLLCCLAAVMAAVGMLHEDHVVSAAPTTPAAKGKAGGLLWAANISANETFSMMTTAPIDFNRTHLLTVDSFSLFLVRKSDGLVTVLLAPIVIEVLRSPVDLGNGMIAVCDDDTLYAINTHNGSIAWKNSKHYCDGPMAVDKEAGTLFVTGSGLFQALDTHDGKLHYAVPYPVQGEYSEVVVAAAGYVFAVGQSSYFAVNASLKDGSNVKFLLNVTVQDCFDGSAPVISEGMIVFFDGRAYRLDTLEHKWTVTNQCSHNLAASGESFLYTAPSVEVVEITTGDSLYSTEKAPNRVYSTSSAFIAVGFFSVVAYPTANSTALWTTTKKNITTYGHGIIYGGYLYIDAVKEDSTPHVHVIVAIKLSTGDLTVTDLTMGGSGLVANPVEIGGVLYFPCFDGYLYAFGPYPY